MLYPFLVYVIEGAELVIIAPPSPVVEPDFIVGILFKCRWFAVA
jgi:hypothetical protein